MAVRVVSVPEGQLSKMKEEILEKNYIVRTHKSINDDCWKLTIVKKEVVDAWKPLVKDMRMITLASPVWVNKEEQ